MMHGITKVEIHSVHTENVIVRWPGQSEPTRGLNAHRNVQDIPDNHVENNPYKVLFG